MNNHGDNIRALIRFAYEKFSRSDAWQNADSMTALYVKRVKSMHKAGLLATEVPEIFDVGEALPPKSSTVECPHCHWQVSKVCASPDDLLTCPVAITRPQVKEVGNA